MRPRKANLDWIKVVLADPELREDHQEAREDLQAASIVIDWNELRVRHIPKPEMSEFVCEK
jgi:hypothetical protein